jgi:RHS repeat-associated protein
MAVINYIRLGNRLLGERPLGGSRTNYATDALGSVTGTIGGASLQNTYAYTPYGSLLKKNGTSMDPYFTWVGSLGYRSTARAWSERYVRARNYAPATATWTSVDPLWPSAGAYRYCEANPVLNSDSSGLCPFWMQGYPIWCKLYDLEHQPYDPIPALPGLKKPNLEHVKPPAIEKKYVPPQIKDCYLVSQLEHEKADDEFGDCVRDATELLNQLTLACSAAPPGFAQLCLEGAIRAFNDVMDLCEYKHHCMTMKADNDYVKCKYPKTYADCLAYAQFKCMGQADPMGLGCCVENELQICWAPRLIE